MIPLITIEGATASGKTALALDLAEALQTSIISCDSRQVYRELNIGTAKATPEEQRRVQHHLIDIINPNQTYNTGLFIKDAAEIIDRNVMEGKLSIICGGTGLYIRSLLEGIFEHGIIKPELRQELQNRLQTEGKASLYMELAQVDPVFAAQISPEDSQRILRGLEIYHATAKALSTHWQEQKREARYKPFRILIDFKREDLYARINQRVGLMLKQGLIEEIQNLLNMGYESTCPGLKTLGYKEFIPFLEGNASLEECSSLTAQHTRNYAKRQVTWYKKCDFDLTITGSDISLLTVVDRVQAKLCD